ncbi:MAG: hypothetical protein H6713_30165 [Myxococcales bacterium]|nr:hypothetical protein [Myxococcales bacterium]
MHGARRGVVMGAGALAVALLGACGPTGGDTETDSATESGTGATTEASDTSTGAPDALCEAPPDPDAPDPVSPDVSCEQLATPETAGDAMIEIVIRNAGDEPLLVYDRVSGCKHAARYYSLEGSAGGRHLSLPFTNCALEWPGCAAAIDGGDCLLCQTLVNPIYVAPGGSFVSEWDGLLLADVEAPEGCLLEGFEGACATTAQAGAGDYTLTAAAARAADCDEAAGTCVDASDCEGGELDERGACQLVTEEPLALPTTETATARWNGLCGQIELVFAGA